MSFYSFISFLYLVFTYLLIIIPGRNYSHYAIILIPCFIFPISQTINQIYVRRIININNKKNILCAIAVIASIVLYLMFFNVKGIVKNFIIDSELPQVIKIVEANTNNNDTISVYGNACWIYLLSNRRSSSKYIYQFPIINNSDSIGKEYLYDINIIGPKIIVVSNKTSMPLISDSAIIIDDLVRDFIKVNYMKIYESSSYNIFKKNNLK